MTSFKRLAAATHPPNSDKHESNMANQETDKVPCTADDCEYKGRFLIKSSTENIETSNEIRRNSSTKRKSRIGGVASK
jgi:hypothetical protein